MLEIKNLHAEVNETKVLKGIDLTVKAGEIHAIMGPNGAGKSSLSRIIAGHPLYTVTEGSVTYEINLKKQNLLTMDTHQRACEGIFMSFQYPLEIPGLSNKEFLRAAFNEVSKYQGSEPMDVIEFEELLEQKMDKLGIKKSLLSRELNVDFSGGEKKQNEIIQMAVLAPRIAFLDETDSGLDIDALKIVATGIQKFKSNHNATVLITHYHRILEHIKPDFVHILKDGKIIKTGDAKLALEIENKGYQVAAS
ncbi:putative ATP-dependent transporter SufC [Spirochaetota bacterium]|nr:putative ATP-dependent transporter SufC [Spirochaetota bacterium]